MRVLMLAQFYPPVVGGEESMVAATSRGLAARGHDVTVATLAVHGAAPRELDHGVDVRRLGSTSGRLHWLYADAGRRHVPPLPDPEVAVHLRRIIADVRPDVIHGHNWLLRSLLPVRLPSATRVVATLHDYGLACPTRRLMRDGEPCSGPAPRRCLACAGAHYGHVKGTVTTAGNAATRRWERSRVDLYIAISNAVVERGDLARRRVPYRVIPNFVPDAFPAAGPPGAPPEDGPIVFVGDAVHEKGIDVLLDAYARLDGAPELLLVGRSDELDGRPLPAGARRVGVVPHDAVGEWWRRASIAVVPSVWPEPFGLVALEAAAHGRPLVASATGGLPDLVEDGISGLLVAPGDPAALADALRRLVASPGLRARVGAAALERSRAFRASTVLPLIEQAYADVHRP